MSLHLGRRRHADRSETRPTQRAATHVKDEEDEEELAQGILCAMVKLLVPWLQLLALSLPLLFMGALLLRHGHAPRDADRGARPASAAAAASDGDDSIVHATIDPGRSAPERRDRDRDRDRDHRRRRHRRRDGRYLPAPPDASRSESEGGRRDDLDLDLDCLLEAVPFRTP